MRNTKISFVFVLILFIFLVTILIQIVDSEIKDNKRLGIEFIKDLNRTHTFIRVED